MTVANRDRDKVNAQGDFKRSPWLQTKNILFTTEIWKCTKPESDMLQKPAYVRVKRILFGWFRVSVCICDISTWNIDLSLIFSYSCNFGKIKYDLNFLWQSWWDWGNDFLYFSFAKSSDSFSCSYHASKYHYHYSRKRFPALDRWTLISLPMMVECRKLSSIFFATKQ